MDFKINLEAKRRPEEWLVTRQLMKLTQTPEYQAQLSLRFGTPTGWLEDDENHTWRKLLKDIMEWVCDLTLKQRPDKDSQMPDWVDLLNVFPNPETETEMYDCLLFWFAHYSLLGSLPYSILLLPSKSAESNALSTMSTILPLKWLQIEHIKHCNELKFAEKECFIKMLTNVQKSKEAT
jgi:hypothetical protein